MSVADRLVIVGFLLFVGGLARAVGVGWALVVAGALLMVAGGRLQATEQATKKGGA